MSVARRLDDIQPIHSADVEAFGDVLPVNAWLVDGRVLVDTGLVDTTPELEAEWPITLRPWPELGPIEAVINTHLHFDHCGGNRRFAGVPTYVQRAELAAVSEPDYVVEWVRFDGADYRELAGDAELFDGISVLSTPGHSPGHQCVLVETDEGLVVLGGDVTYSMDELVAGGQPNFDRIHALRPRRVYLAHASEPWNPRW
jgi:N-acyl homoserine lactone hydrolase